MRSGYELKRPHLLAGIHHINIEVGPRVSDQSMHSHHDVAMDIRSEVSKTCRLAAYKALGSLALEISWVEPLFSLHIFH
jgi:hypothetical protein